MTCKVRTPAGDCCAVVVSLPVHDKALLIVQRPVPRTFRSTYLKFTPDENDAYSSVLEEVKMDSRVLYNTSKADQQADEQITPSKRLNVEMLIQYGKRQYLRARFSSLH